jgi:hypothetical protein
MPPRNPQQEKEIMEWMTAVMGEPLPAGDFAEILKNGVILCQLMNKLSPGSVKKFKLNRQCSIVEFRLFLCTDE